jgi:hypothetical protein
LSLVIKCGFGVSAKLYFKYKIKPPLLPMQNIRKAESIVVAALLTVLMISAFTLSSLATSAFAQDGAGVCRNNVNGPCGTAAPPTNPCSNKPGTISWPSSGGCVPPFCPAGGNKEVRGARLNNGECDPNFNSSSGGNNTNNNNNTPISNTNNSTNSGGGTGTAGGAGSTTGTGIAGVVAAAAFPIGYVPDISVSPPEPPFVWPESGVWPSEPPITESPITSTGSTAAEGAAEGAVEGATEGAAEGAVTGIGAGAVALVGVAIGVGVLGYWIGCGFQFC